MRLEQRVAFNDVQYVYFAINILASVLLRKARCLFLSRSHPVSSRFILWQELPADQRHLPHASTIRFLCPSQQLDAHDTALKRIRQSAGEIRQSLTPEPPVQARSADPVLVAARSDGAQAESLQAQVRMLQDDIRRRASEEERLIRVNSQLKERVEEAMDTNNRNVEAAESELLRLSQELQATRERADQTAEQARVEMQRVKEESARREEAALRAVEEAEARGRAQMERMRSKVEDETRDRMRADVEESLRQERERAELAAEETRKLLEARIKALQVNACSDIHVTNMTMPLGAADPQVPVICMTCEISILQIARLRIHVDELCKHRRWWTRCRQAKGRWRMRCRSSSAMSTTATGSSSRPCCRHEATSRS